MDTSKTSSSINFKLVEGQEKQSLLNKYINDSTTTDRDGIVEVFQTNIDNKAKPKRKANSASHDIDHVIINTKTGEEQPKSAQHTDSITNLSQTIKASVGKKKAISQEIRTRILSRDNIAKVIQNLM